MKQYKLPEDPPPEGHPPPKPPVDPPKPDEG